jgi:hypothetical protein
MFIAVEAVLRVKVELLAGSEREGLHKAKNILARSRRLELSTRRRRWLEHLFVGPPPHDSALIVEVIDVRVVSSSYAAGE